MTDINFDSEAIRKDIMNEIDRIGFKVIEINYNGAKELSSIVEKIDRLYKDFNKTFPVEAKKIEDRYSQQVANEKIKELENDYIGEKCSLAADMDLILDKEIKYRKEALNKKLSDTDYQRTRSEATQILLALGDKLDQQTTMELVKPIIEAKDLTYLKILDKTANRETKYIYIEGIKQAENYTNVEDLRKAITEAKFYANNPQRGRSAGLENFIFMTDRNIYNRLKSK